MFSNTDYKSLVSSGVDLGMIALVESAYRAIFEAKAPELKNKLVPFNYEEAAKALGLDFSDCMPEGKLNTTMLVRKLNEDPRFLKVDRKVNDIINVAMDAIGLGYKDEGGAIRYAYPNGEMNREWSNVLENLKTVLKEKLVSYAAGMAPDAFVRKVDEISPEHAGRYLAATELSGLEDNISTRRRSARQFDMQYCDMSQVDIGQAREDKLFGKFNVVMKNEDGTCWCEPRDGDTQFDRGAEDRETAEANGIEYRYLVTHNGRIVCKIVLVDGTMTGIEPVYGDNDVRSDLSNISYDHPWIVDREQAMWHDVVNYIVQGNISVELPPNVFNREIETREIVEKTLPSDAVRLLRWNEEDGIALLCNGMELSKLHRLAFLVRAFDEHLLDRDDLIEVAKMCMQPYSPDQSGYSRMIMKMMTPELMRLAKKCRVLNTWEYDENGDPAKDVIAGIGGLLLDSHPDEIIGAITGTPVHIPGLPGDAWNKVDPTNRLRNEFGRPEVRMYLYRQIGFADFLNAMERAISKSGYIPLDEDIVVDALTGTDSDARKNAYLLVKYYFLVLSDTVGSDISGLIPTARQRMSLFDEIRRYLTPDVQETALLVQLDGEHHSNYMLRAIAKRVPDFSLCDSIALDMANDVNGEERLVSPKNLLRQMREFLAGDNVVNARVNFLRVCMEPGIMNAVRSSTPVGKRILGCVAKLAEYSNLALLRHDTLETYLADGDDSLPEFVETYFLPIWDSLVLVDKNILVPRVRAKIGEVLDTYAETFVRDESVAVKAFLDRKRGIFKCASNQLVDNGGKKKMVSVDEPLVRVALLNGIAYNTLGNTEGSMPKCYVALVGACIAGKGLFDIIVNESGGVINVDSCLADLFKLDTLYRASGESAENAPQVVDVDDVSKMIEKNPSSMLGIVGYLSPELAREVCDKCFTVEGIRAMGTTPEGLELLLRLADIGNIDGAQWRNFAEAFTRGNENNIRNMLKGMTSEDADKFRKRLELFMGESDRKPGFAAVTGTELDSTTGDSVEYSMANGLKWMRGFFTGGTPVCMSEDGQAGLYTREQAAEFMESDGWRLPTVADIIHLGDNPDTITEEQLGFTPTGMADAEGNLVSGSEDFCIAWCRGEDGPVPYMVDANNLIDTESDEVSPEYMLAIKLVR